MTPFIETIHSKEGLIEACKKGFEQENLKKRFLYVFRFYAR